MSIAAVSQSLNYTRIQASNESAAAPTRPVQRDRDERYGERPPRAGGGNERPVADALAQALSSVGLSLPPPPEKRVSGDVAGGSPGGSKEAGDVGQALQGFMHTLFHAIRSPAPEAPPRNGDDAKQGGDKGEAASAPAGSVSGYGVDLASKAQDLLDDLSSQDGAKTSPAANNLDASFKELVRVLQKNSEGSASASASQATLTSFLQKFIQNLQANGGATSILGGAVNEFS